MKTYPRLLHVIGFTQQEIKKLLFHPETSTKLPMSVLVDFNQIVGEKFGGDIEVFCETLRRRLEIIRSEAETLGVGDIFEIYKFCFEPTCVSGFWGFGYLLPAPGYLTR